MPIVYDELRSLAAELFRGSNKRHTLQPTALVHEAFVRLAKSKPGDWKNEAHFRAVAAKVMRQILIDHARRVRASKRGGDARRVHLASQMDPAIESQADLLDMDELVQRLTALDARQGALVELRFFGGLSCAEAAEVLGVSRRTAELDWRFARAWLRRQLDDMDAA